MQKQRWRGLLSCSGLFGYFQHISFKVIVGPGFESLHPGKQEGSHRSYRPLKKWQGRNMEVFLYTTRSP